MVSASSSTLRKTESFFFDCLYLKPSCLTGKVDLGVKTVYPNRKVAAFVTQLSYDASYDLPVKMVAIQ